MRRTSGNLLETAVDAFGKHVVMDDGTPVITNTLVSDPQTRGAPTTCSSSSAVRVGMEGVLGVQGGELPQFHLDPSARSLSYTFDLFATIYAEVRDFKHVEPASVETTCSE